MAKVDVQAKADSEFYKPLIFTPSVPPPPGAPKGRCEGRCRKTPCPGTAVSVNRELKPNSVIRHQPKAEQHALNSEPSQPGERSTVLTGTLQEELIHTSPVEAQYMELTAEELDAILMEVDTPGGGSINSEANDKTDWDYTPRKSMTFPLIRAT